MTKTIDGKTYELVSEIIPARPDAPVAHPNCNCYDCAAIHDRLLCKALGDSCITKGVWKEVIPNG